jgi:hypothetical protein
MRRLKIPPGKLHVSANSIISALSEGDIATLRYDRSEALT